MAADERGTPVRAASRDGRVRVGLLVTGGTMDFTKGIRVELLETHSVAEVRG